MLRYALLAAVVVLFAAGCKPATMERQGEVAPATATAPQPSPGPAPVGTTAGAPAAGERISVETARGYEVWKLVAVVPEEALERAKTEGTCPKTFLGVLFGVDFSNPHGNIIGKLTEGGPASQAGLRVGDSIVACNGREVSCPQVLEPVVQESFRGPTPGKLTMTIHRPMAAAGTK